MLFLYHIHMHRKTLRVSNERAVGVEWAYTWSWFSLIPSLRFTITSHAGTSIFPMKKNARWKQLMEGRLISAYIVKGTDHHGGTTRQPAEVCGRENCEGTC